jgi:hypothetical protein
MYVTPSLVRRCRLFAGPVAAAWLFGSASAWAGGASGFVFPLQMVLDKTCSSLGIANCPQLPTTNQLVVEIAALTNTTPSDVRNNALPGAHIDPLGAADGGTHGGTVTPLAFISSPLGPPIPTQPNNPAANSFISATVSQQTGTLGLTFDYLPRTNPTFTLGQDVGDITLPFEVTDAHGNKLRDLSAVLEIRGTGGTAVTTDVVGNFSGTGTQTFSLSQLGLSFALDFSKGFAEFDVGAPLLIDANLEPAYSPFSAAGFEFANGLFEGIDPVADMFLSANFADNANDPLAVDAHLAVSRNGDTVLSSPGLPEPSTLALLGGFLGLGLASLLWRRAARRPTEA